MWYQKTDAAHLKPTQDRKMALINLRNVDKHVGGRFLMARIEDKMLPIRSCNGALEHC